MVGPPEIRQRSGGGEAGVTSDAAAAAAADASQAAGEVLKEVQAWGRVAVTPRVSSVADTLRRWVHNMHRLVLFLVHTALTAVSILFHARVEQRAAEHAARVALAAATTYEGYAAAAGELDVLQGHERWKAETETPLYNYTLITERLQQLRDAEGNGDKRLLLRQLRSGLLRNLGGTTGSGLYNVANIGTKYLVMDYIKAVTATLRQLRDDDSVPLDERYFFFQDTRHAFGRSALLLSGGAGWGMYHLGVVKALYEHGVLPRVISGSSVGSLVAAIVACTTDEDIPKLFESGALNVDAFEVKDSANTSFQRKVSRLVRKGYVFDIRKLEDCVRANIGDMTFLEAYEKTHRILNITVASTTEFQFPRLLNYLTAPHVLIRSAACASCALPGLYEPVELMCKLDDGELVPYSQSKLEWKDGSLENDLPMARPSELFNVNHTIVSQVNPHVLPFMWNSRRKPTIFSKIYNLCVGELHHRLMQLYELDLMPRFARFLQPLFTQRYVGDVTLTPSIGIDKFLRLLKNPSDAEIQEAIRDGERTVWPYMSLIKNRVSIENTLDRCVLALKPRVKRYQFSDVAR